jgi:GT2 family glycosyltransferase
MPAERLIASATGIVIVNFGDPTDTLACLTSLERSTDLDLEIVVVHNGTEDADAARLRAGVEARAEIVISGDNLGFAGGSNLGIQRVLDLGVDLVWLLNPDTEIEPDTLAVLRHRLTRSPDCGVIGPRILRPAEPPVIWFDGGIVNRERGATRHLHQNRPIEEFVPECREIDYVTGAGLLARREVFDDIGLLPEQYFLYYEETDWCLRAAAAGWRILVDQSATMWHHKRSSGDVPEPYHLYYMTRNRYTFARDALGLDPEMALNDIVERWVAKWRARVATADPGWLPTFDDLVDRACADARAGVTGRVDAVAEVPRGGR